MWVKRRKKSRYYFRTRLSSTNNVCRWWKQESLSFKLEALSLWAQDSPFDRIHDKSTGMYIHLRSRKLPQSFRHHLETEGKWATDRTKNLQCRKESNQFSRTSVRGLFGARMSDPFFSRALLSKSARQPQTRNKTHMSEAIQAIFIKLLVLQSDQTLKHNSLTKSSSCSSARSITSTIEFIDWPARKF